MYCNVRHFSSHRNETNMIRSLSSTKKKRGKETDMLCGCCDWNFRSIVMSNRFHPIETKTIWYDPISAQQQKLKKAFSVYHMIWFLSSTKQKKKRKKKKFCGCCDWNFTEDNYHSRSSLITSLSAIHMFTG